MTLISFKSHRRSYKTHTYMLMMTTRIENPLMFTLWYYLVQQVADSHNPYPLTNSDHSLRLNFTAAIQFEFFFLKCPFN